MVISVADVRGESGPRNLLKAVRWLGSFLPEEKLSRGFWIFFTAAFFFDLGISLYFFLFNLFLANSHFNEKFLGLATGALTLGNVAGTIPIGLAVRRYGLRPALLFCFVATPCIGILRALVLWPPAQIGLSFLCGVALSSWPVCFAPTVARLTTEKNRVSAFSIAIATGIGTGTLAGLVGGYLPGMLVGTGGEKHLAEGMRLVLVFACGFVMLGIWPVLKLDVKTTTETDKPRIRIFHPFLYRFLPAFALWSVVTGSFVPFAAVFLQQHLGIPMRYVGLIFAGSQLTQFVAALVAPILYRRWGIITGIVFTQIATGVAVLALAHAHGTAMAVSFYLGYMGAQFMSGPGLYSLLMTRVPDAERSTASAVQNIAGALCQAASAAITGICLVRYGYSAVLSGNAVVALAASLMLFALLSMPRKEKASESSA